MEGRSKTKTDCSNKRHDLQDMTKGEEELSEVATVLSATMSLLSASCIVVVSRLVPFLTAE